MYRNKVWCFLADIFWLKKITLRDGCVLLNFSFCGGAGTFLILGRGMCNRLGHDMGGCKTYRKTYQRTRPPEKFWTPPKELLVWGVQNPFLGGVSFVRFFSPLFFPPPHGVLPLNRGGRINSAYSLRGLLLHSPQHRCSKEVQRFKVPLAHNLLACNKAGRSMECAQISACNALLLY